MHFGSRSAHSLADDTRLRGRIKSNECAIAGAFDSSLGQLVVVARLHTTGGIARLYQYSDEGIAASTSLSLSSSLSLRVKGARKFLGMFVTADWFTVEQDAPTWMRTGPLPAMIRQDVHKPHLQTAPPPPPPSKH